MKAIRSIDGAPQVVDVPAPSGEGVRVKIHSSGICGSDLHMLDLGIFNPEITMGHEFAGYLDDGTPVAVEPVAFCGACVQCTSGDYNLCHKAVVDVLGFGQDGGMAEEAMISPHQIVHLPMAASVEDACLIEPLAVCVRALRLAGFGGNQRVAIIGGGNIGQCATAVVRHFGAPVVVLARHEAQRQAAQRLGAETPDDPAEIPASSFDIVVDAAGTTSALQDAARLTAPSGAISLVSTYWEGMEVPSYAQVRSCSQKWLLFSKLSVPVPNASNWRSMAAVAPHTVSPTSSKKLTAALPMAGMCHNSSLKTSSRSSSATGTYKICSTSSGSGFNPSGLLSPTNATWG